MLKLSGRLIHCPHRQRDEPEAKTKQNKMKSKLQKEIKNAQAAYNEAMNSGNLGQMERLSKVIDRLTRVLAAL